jgi:hypothetical protein
MAHPLCSRPAARGGVRPVRRQPRPCLPPAPTVLALLLLALLLLTMAGCGGGGDDITPPPPDNRIDLAGTITLPAGCPANPDLLSVIDASAVADVAADGAFTIAGYAGDRLLGIARGPGDAPLLMGWLAEGRTELSARTTAEVLAWFGVGAWLLPPAVGDTVRLRLQGLTAELAPLEAALEAEIVAHPRGFDAANPALQSALDATVGALLNTGRWRGGLASAAGAGALPDKGLLIQPGEERSGIAVLNQGGVNRVTFKNSWRRRAVIFLKQIRWIDDVGGEHPITAAPDSVQEIAPVGGFAGVFGTIASAVTGDIAYTPVKTDPHDLALVPGSRYTDYEVVVGGPGGGDDQTGGALTPARLQTTQYTALKAMAWDLFLPLVLNVLATRDALDESIEMGDTVLWEEAVGWINWIGNNLAPVLTYAYHGQVEPALRELWIAVSGTGDFQELTLTLIRNIAERAGMAAGEAGGAMDAAREYLAVVGWIDIVGNYLDSAAVVSQMAAADFADRWEIRVTKPAVHLTASQNTLGMFARVDSLWARVQDEGTEPEGWAWSYRWRCTGHAGTLKDPMHPDDTSNDFVSSSRKVSYEADRGAGEERIIVDVSMRQGNEVSPVGSDTLTLTVTGYTVSVSPDSSNCAAGGVRRFTAKLDPPAASDLALVYAWSGGGSAGTLTSDADAPAPFESDSPEAVYHGGVADGDDVLHVQVYHEKDDGSRVSLGRARAKAQVRTAMIEGSFNVDFWIDENQRCQMVARVTFPKRPGVTHYRVHGYNFYDFAYYGSSYDESGPPFWPGYEDLGGSYRIGLTGCNGCCDDGSLNWYRARFAGSIWEIWPLN